MAICLGGTKIVSDMQGPCPDGFHVPTRDEFQAIMDIGTNLGLWSSSNTSGMKTYLKIPMYGYITGTSSPSFYSGTGWYWSCTYLANYQGYALCVYSGNSGISNKFIVDGASIRAVKDFPVTPDSSWTALYSNKIYHNSTLGLISLSSNGTNWVTIADKNLGATTVYNSGDTMSESNCGKLYQRGNNYGFPTSGFRTITNTQVDASSYGPGNYYSSDSFRYRTTTPYTWDSSKNPNLRGGVSQGTTEKKVEPKKIYYGEPIIVSDMQGPCPDGFHVPLSSEWQAIINIWTSLGGGSSDGTNFGIALKLPFAGYRYGDSSNVANQGRVARYSTSNLNHIFWNSSQITLINNDDTSSAFSIRPFRNIAVVPTSSWTKLYGTSIEAGGIFWNSTDGLISLSGDGQNWITISDKNLGATEVWNSGDTLSEANAGKYYQSGNNYGFQRTGTISNYSYSQVNASNYGPGNYYSSPTFIVRTTSPFTWESSGNMNIRGGVTQGTSEKATEVKAVYLGEVKVRPTFKPKTFTISRTEQSNMSSGWTYSDDAAGLTAGDTAFDEFFGYYGCRLNTSGQETATITQEQSGGAGKLDITQLGTLTSGDNVMIAFPVRGIKMTKSGSTVTLSITEELNKDGYQYYAHSTGTLSNPGTPKDAFYLGAYKGYSDSNVLKSWSGQAVTANMTQSTSCTRAKANGSGYNICGFYQRMYIAALYMMKYGNPDSQTTVGQGYTGGSTRVQSGGTNSQTNATYGTTNTKTQIKLFGLENWWGNGNEWVGGAYRNSSRVLYTKLTGWTGTTSGDSTGTTMGNVTGNPMSSISGTNNGMFVPLGTYSSSDYSKYYCDYAYCSGSSSYLIAMSGDYSSGNQAGVFYFYANYSTSATANARLMYLNGLT